MRAAIDEAKKALARQEVPIGAVVVCDNMIVARAHNLTETLTDPTAHAEMQALRAGTRRQASPSLAGCTLYASGHPCPMCLAALLMAGCGQVFYAFDNQDATPYGLSNEGWYRCLRLPLVPPPLPLSRLDTGISAAQLYGDAPWPQA